MGEEERQGGREIEAGEGRKGGRDVEESGDIEKEMIY